MRAVLVLHTAPLFVPWFCATGSARIYSNAFLCFRMGPPTGVSAYTLWDKLCVWWPPGGLEGLWEQIAHNIKPLQVLEERRGNRITFWYLRLKLWILSFWEKCKRQGIGNDATSQHCGAQVSVGNKTNIAQDFSLSDSELYSPILNNLPVSECLRGGWATRGRTWAATSRWTTSSPGLSTGQICRRSVRNIKFNLDPHLKKLVWTVIMYHFQEDFVPVLAEKMSNKWASGDSNNLCI